MDVIAINGSPRKTMNTSSLLNAANEELINIGKTTKVYNLYEMNYKSCWSCFSCKRERHDTYGKCLINDDLKQVFEEIRECKALILATPIFYGDLGGQMRSFIERLLFQNTVYSNPPRSLFPKRIKVGMIYTMNIAEEVYPNYPLKTAVDSLERTIGNILGETNSFFAFATNQLNDYEGIEYTYFDTGERLKRHKEHFPKELKRVREFARHLVK